jgi:dCMP deaminase
VSKKGFDDFGRPLWDYYFLSLAFVVAQRSLDPVTKHGTVIVNEDKAILSTGYNGPPSGCDDTKVPLDRQHKYPWMIHSEEAAIVNAAKTGVCLKNSIFYITGYPCSRCMRKIINLRAKKIFYSIVSFNGADEDRIISEQMLKGQNIDIEMLKNTDYIINILDKTKSYIFKKNKGSS